MHNGHARNGDPRVAQNMVKSSRDDTIRKEFQRIQESNRNVFEHPGQQQVKRMQNGQSVAPQQSQRHHHGSAFNDFNKQQQMAMAPGYRASAYPMGKESPREHVKMRHDPRLGPGPQQRIGIAGIPAADYRRHSRPVSHHQAMSPLNAAAPHLTELANNDRKRREKASQQNAHLHHRDSRGGEHHRSGSGRDRSGARMPNGNHHQQQQGSSHLARVSASIPASISPLRKMSEPGRPEVCNL